MTKTEKYQLPQWELSDRIMMEDFNEAMSNIEDGIEGAKAEAKSGDAALAQSVAALTEAVGTAGKTARITYGTYKGTKKSVTVDFKPLVVYVGYTYGGGFMRFHIMFRGFPYTAISVSAGTNVKWTDNSVSWEDTTNDNQTSSTVNYYVVIGVSE